MSKFLRIFGTVHSGAALSPSAARPALSTGPNGAYRQAMEALAPTYPTTYAQPVKLADALIAALRSPEHAAPVLRPVADELEAVRARR